MRNSGERRLQNFITAFCTACFAIFSFTFIAIYKSPLIEMVYNSVATGKLQYNGYVLSGVVTAILVGLALWLNRFAKFQREWTAMAFLPSALLLAFLTDIERTIFVGNGSLVEWAWIFVIGIAFYLFLSFLLARILFKKIKNPTMVANRIVWRNLVLLTLTFLSIGYLSGGDKNFMREAVQYKYYCKGDADAALAVGAHSPLASQQITAQRAFLLSLKGELGERLFEYPQYYGADGLLPTAVRTMPVVPDSIYSHIGLSRAVGESVTDFLARAVGGDSVSIVAQEYYLSSLLLERRIVDFADKVYEFYNVSDELPKHYKEALVLYSYIVPEYSLAFNADDMSASLKSMIEAVKHKGKASVFSAQLQAEYGNTYWWYFLYGE
ncbi:MAG: hypothetical protein IJ436_06980 [Bacteroidaceae bacterium]|nr:hypothetical protein [Bacteroidaceae bacterium]